MTHDALIAHMDAWLARHRPDYHASLQPGVSEAALDAFEAGLPAPLPAAWRALYRWRNGQSAACLDSLQGNRMFCPLEDVQEIKEMLDGMSGFDFEDPATWRRGWLPFLANGGGSYLCLDLQAEGGGTPGQLLAFWKGDADRPVEHGSVEEWLAALVRAMDDGSLEIL